MGRRLDWRWVAVIVGVLLLAVGAGVPWFVRAIGLIGGGTYLLWYGWGVWARGGVARGKVTYWRGQRMEVGPQRRGPALPRLADIGPAVVWLALGLVLTLAGVALALAAYGY